MKASAHCGLLAATAILAIVRAAPVVAQSNGDGGLLGGLQPQSDGAGAGAQAEINPQDLSSDATSASSMEERIAKLTENLDKWAALTGDTVSPFEDLAHARRVIDAFGTHAAAIVAGAEGMATPIREETAAAIRQLRETWSPDQYQVILEVRTDGNTVITDWVERASGFFNDLSKTKDLVEGDKAKWEAERQQLADALQAAVTRVNDLLDTVSNYSNLNPGQPIPQYMLRQLAIAANEVRVGGTRLLLFQAVAERDAQENAGALDDFGPFDAINADARQRFQDMIQRKRSYDATSLVPQLVGLYMDFGALLHLDTRIQQADRDAIDRKREDLVVQLGAENPTLDSTALREKIDAEVDAFVRSLDATREQRLRAARQQIQATIDTLEVGLALDLEEKLHGFHGLNATAELDAKRAEYNEYFRTH